MLEIGKFNRLEVLREVDFGFYLQSDKGDILIPRKYVPEGTKIGEIMNVFVYTDSEDRLIATTLDPIAVVGEFAAMKVKDVTNFGAFLDWGIEKDLLVPNSEQHRKLFVGQTTVVRLCLDQRTERVIGVGKLNPFLKKDLSTLQEGQAVNLMVYDETDLGFMVLIDDQYSGMLYENEVFEPLEIGDKKKGFIKKVRPDGKIDVRLFKEGMAGIEASKNTVLKKLKSSGGFLPYHDKSDSEAIIEAFQMSKKAFKKAVGGLYKEGKIQILDDGIQLK